MKSNSNDKKEIASIDTGIICMKSSPCCHDVTIKYQDGSSERKNLTADKIIQNYEKYLNDADKKHFAYIKKSENEILPLYTKDSQNKVLEGFFKLPKIEAKQNLPEEKKRFEAKKK